MCAKLLMILALFNKFLLVVLMVVMKGCKLHFYWFLLKYPLFSVVLRKFQQIKDNLRPCHNKFQIKGCCKC
jgi:hypothetical protein